MAVLNTTSLEHLPQSYLKENIGLPVTVSAIVFLVVQTIAIALFYSSRYVTKTLRNYDCWLFIPLGYLCATTICILAVFLVKEGGTGRHVEAIRLEDPSGHIFQFRAKIHKALEYLQYASITGSKLTVLALYMRIFGADRKYRVATYMIGILVLLNFLAVVFTVSTICQPFAAWWDDQIPGGKCGNILVIWKSVSVPNIATDLMILVLPLPALYKLHVDIGTKIGLYLTFMVGSVGVLTSILKLLAFMNVNERHNDPTYQSGKPMVYTIAEVSTYLIAACMPALRALKRHLFADHTFSKCIGAFFSKWSRSSKETSNSRFRTSERVALDMRVARKQALETPDDTKLLTFQEEHVCLTRLENESQAV